MRFLDLVVAAAALGLRLIAVPPGRWGLDWIVVAALFWMGHCAAGAHLRARQAVFAVAGLWLTLIYALHQGPWITAGLPFR
jgi:hypothetical protein